MKLEWRAVLTGAAVDLGSSAFFCGVVWIGFAAILSAGGSSTKEIYAALYSSGFAAVLLCFGLSFNALGGFVSASIAGRRHLLFGALSAAPCFMLSLFRLLDPLPTYFPIWSFLAGWFLSVPFGMLGGLVASKRA